MEHFCGLCKAKGLKKQLILFQLNLEEAILLCENKEVSSFSGHVLALQLSLLYFVALNYWRDIISA